MSMVQADTNTNPINSVVDSEDPTSVTLPVYQVLNFGDLNMDHPLGIDATVPFEENYQIPFPSIKNGEFGTDKNVEYQWSAPIGEDEAGVYKDGLPRYRESNKEMKCFYVTLYSFKPFLHFIDSSDDQEVGVSTDRQLVYVGDQNNGGILLDEPTKVELPKGYELDEKQENYKLGDSLENKKIYVHKYDPDANENNVNFVVNKHIEDESGVYQSEVEPDRFRIPYDDVEELKNNLTGISKNSQFTPTLSNEKGHLKIGDTEANVPSNVIWQTFENATADLLTEYKGNTITIDLYYQYNDDPIDYDVVIPSNLDPAMVPTVPAEGKLGEKLSIKVPKVSGYKADKDTISATVNADGTITSTDKVNYTKESNGNSSSGSHSNVHYFDVDLHIATIHGNKAYVTDKKKVENGEIYYRVGDGHWLSASDVYIYEDFNGYVRTYSDSYKSLINANAEIVKNRALARASDWFSDRTALFNGDKYYRVATNEWVKSNDVFEYRINQTIINVPAWTILYNERGQQMRADKKESSLRTDRIAQINGKEYYRVATNEYVLVSDVIK